MRSLFSVLWDVCLDGDDSTLYTWSVDMETRGTEASSAAVLQCCSAAEVSQRWELRECSPPDDNESGAACSELQRCRARQQCAVSTHTAVSTLSTLQHLQYILYLSSIYTVALTGSILSVLYQQYLQLSIYTVHSIYTAVGSAAKYNTAAAAQRWPGRPRAGCGEDV